MSRMNTFRLIVGVSLMALLFAVQTMAEEAEQAAPTPDKQAAPAQVHDHAFLPALFADGTIPTPIR